ncbi:hypothetical protein NC651_005476 [Populus alba x Populus x berolinensis]|nr:hypothetical protein NC651_005476 [Populus alba x Populus x berolinensis]
MKLRFFFKLSCRKFHRGFIRMMWRLLPDCSILHEPAVLHNLEYNIDMKSMKLMEMIKEGRSNSILSQRVKSGAGMTENN